MTDAKGDRREAAIAVGLCATCRYSTVIENDRKSRFYFCERSRVDDRFPRYPRLPVVACAGWERSE